MKSLSALIALLLITASCSASKNKATVNRRSPEGNLQMTQDQKKEVEHRQVESIIKEYQFEENLTPTPIAEITLNQAAPNYSEPESVITTATDGNDVATEDFKAMPFNENNYQHLSQAPKHKIATDKHKKILAKKRLELEEMKKKAQKSKNETPREHDKKITPSPKITQEEKTQISSKLEQLQGSATIENTSIEDKKKRQDSQVDTTQPNHIDTSKIPPKTESVMENTPKVTSAPELNNNISTNEVTPPNPTPPAAPLTINQSQENEEELPPLPTLNQPSSSTNDPEPPAIPSLDNAQQTPHTPTPQTNSDTPQPNNTTKDQPVPNKPSDHDLANEVKAELKILTSKKIKVNKDQSVEVSPAKEKAPPLPLAPIEQDLPTKK